MYRYLFYLDGIDRYEKIKELSVVDRSIIHTVYRRCDRCPLGLKHVDGLGVPRILCTDVAKEKSVLEALGNGGRFIGEG